MDQLEQNPSIYTLACDPVQVYTPPRLTGHALPRRATSSSRRAGAGSIDSIGLVD